MKWVADADLQWEAAADQRVALFALSAVGDVVEFSHVLLEFAVFETQFVDIVVSVETVTCA